MSGALVRARRERGVDVVVLDSPANRNALSIRLLTELIQQVGISAAGAGRALLLTHTGPVFCPGVDLKERRALGAGDDRHSRLLAGLLRALWDYPRPVLCRIDGAVRGGGMGLVACADVTVCSPSSTFAYSEVRVGVAPALVCSLALVKVAPAPLLPWLLTGESFDATIAARIGLVTRVGADAEAELDGIRRGAPGAVAATKAIARELAGVDVAAVITRMQAASAELFASTEAREGLAAFAERRPPAWSIAD